uniref:Uncharacterized protein n=1 Tax=Arundo donax TaxID=35708 RepID=A0A0A9C8K8_ARUDO
MKVTIIVFAKIYNLLQLVNGYAR